MANRYMIPIEPVRQPRIPTIYPWDNDSFLLLCHALYKRAQETGYKESFELFQENLGTFMDATQNVTLYEGTYEAIPMANFDQVLHTARKILQEDIVIEKIPYYETSNDAGGYTVIIG